MVRFTLSGKSLLVRCFRTFFRCHGGVLSLSSANTPISPSPLTAVRYSDSCSGVILGRENKYEEVFNSTRLKPIKNHEELGNILKEVSYSLVINKLKDIEEYVKDVKQGEGKIIEIDGQKVGAYRNEKGELFLIKPYCSHLGCMLSWNNLDKTWDCPCHGSRFSYEGKQIYDPAIKDLEKYN